MSAPPVVPPRPTKDSEATTTTAAPAPPSIPARPARNRSPLPQGETGTSENPEGVHFQEPSTTTTTTSATAEGSSHRPSSPETRRKIDPDLDLHQPMAVRPTTDDADGPEFVDESNLPPEIGQRVPMLPYAGDVQAPSPGPGSRSVSRNKRRSQHGTKTPHGDQPEGMIVGDFGAYPSGQNVYKQGGTYSLSRDDLSKSVLPRDNPAGVATTPGLEGVPDEEIGYAAADEIASRDYTPVGTPAAARLPTKSPLSQAISALEGEDDEDTEKLSKLDAESDGEGIYGKGGAQFNASSTSLKVPSGRHTPHNNWEELQDEHAEGTPILASDEAGKNQYFQPPAVSPRLTAQELRRPGSVGKQRQSPSIVPEDDISEPSSPVREHVPLFPAGAPPRPQSRPKLEGKGSSQFPSKDIWEDAPESTHATYEVEESEEAKPDPEYYNPRAKKADEAAAAPEIPSRPVKKESTDENSPSTTESKTAPSVPERPKVPPRPGKKPGDASTEVSSPEEPRSPPILKPKPVVPAKGGIAALRANFMNDLNSRLSKGPQAPKKEESLEAPEAEPKEREPLEDVRKSRARGPAKRKPTSATDSAAAPAISMPKLTFSSIITVYSIGDDYEVSFDETKFDDEPSKIARPIEKLAAGLKSATTEEVDTTKEVVVSEEEVPESKPEVPAAEKAVAA